MTTAALVSLAVILYTYVGYPALVLVWARLVRVPADVPYAYEPTVSVCLPVHDGARYVSAKIRSLQELDYPRDKIEILVFSDGSTDGTDELVRRLAASDPRIRLLSDPRRRGKPTALNRLRAAAAGEVLLMCDVRQPFDRKALRALLRPLADPSVGCASGTLVLGGNAGAGAYWRYELAIRQCEARIRSLLGVSGSIYAIRRAQMPELPEDILLDDMFVPLCLALGDRKRIVLCEAAQAFEDASDDGREFARKVRTLAGNYQLIGRMPRLLVPGMNPLWFHLTSHKVLRLVCPWALVVLFCASGVLALQRGGPLDGFWQVVFASQAACYSAAVLGSRAGRVGVLSRTFLVMNAAAVVGLWRFLRRSQVITW